MKNSDKPLEILGNIQEYIFDTFLLSPVEELDPDQYMDSQKNTFNIYGLKYEMNKNSKRIGAGEDEEEQNFIYTLCIKHDLIAISCAKYAPRDTMLKLIEENEGVELSMQAFLPSDDDEDNHNFVTTTTVRMSPDKVLSTASSILQNLSE